jgi:hypothetical protein
MSIARSTVIFLALALGAFMPALARAECNGPAPSVSSIFPFSQITPGGGVILLGSNFGNNPGQFEVFLTNYQGTAVVYQLQDLTWGDSAVSGVIPDYAFEVMNQTALFFVVTQCGFAIYPAQFTANTSYNLVSTDRIGCWSGVGLGASDRCNNSGGTNYPAECGHFSLFGDAPISTGFGGYHASGWGGGSPPQGSAFPLGIAADYFWAELNNDWVFEGLIPDASDFQFTVGIAGNGGFAGLWWISSSGTNFPEVQVNWHAAACGQVEYYSSQMLILGPTLVPY